MKNKSNNNDAYTIAWAVLAVVASAAPIVILACMPLIAAAIAHMIG